MKLLTPEEVAEGLSVSRSTVLRMIADNSLPAICLRSGPRKKVWRIRQEQLDRWIVAKERQGLKGQREAHAAERPEATGNNDRSIHSAGALDLGTTAQ